MKIKKRIFTEKIEGIPISFFDSRYKTLIKEELKNKFGVYALYDNKKRLYYIGIAQHSIANRIKQHKRNIHKDQWQYFSVYFTKKKDFIKSLEDAFISIVLPKGNIQKPMKIDKGNKRITKKMEKIDKDKRLSMFDSRKDKTYKATLLKSGKIKYENKLYNSPTAAAQFIVSKRSPGSAVNGWHFWFIKNSDNKWVKLSHLD